jgi:hypothetical protein
MTSLGYSRAGKVLVERGRWFMFDLTPAYVCTHFISTDGEDCGTFKKKKKKKKKRKRGVKRASALLQQHRGRHGKKQAGKRYIPRSSGVHPSMHKMLSQDPRRRRKNVLFELN